MANLQQRPWRSCCVLPLEAVLVFIVKLLIMWFLHTHTHTHTHTKSPPAYVCVSVQTDTHARTQKYIHDRFLLYFYIIWTVANISPEWEYHEWQGLLGIFILDSGWERPLLHILINIELLVAGRYCLDDATNPIIFEEAHSEKFW